MKVRSMVLAAVLGAISLLIVAGCGGGSSSSSTGGGAGGEAFASGAEAACAGANKQIAALGTPQQEQVLEYMETTETVVEGLDEEVRALAGSGSGSAEAAYAEALDKAVIVLNEMANAARNENYDAVRELSDGLVQLHLGELAEVAGLKTCAEVPVSV